MRQIIVVAGPTAVGKTKYAIAIAKAVGGEIVSCDSMQLYKYMNIGSAKPTQEEQREVKHYLVDEIDPREPFSVAKYRALAKQAIEEIFQRGKVPVISGGTGLYLNALLYEMDFSNAPQDTALRKTVWKRLPAQKTRSNRPQNSGAHPPKQHQKTDSRAGGRSKRKSNHGFSAVQAKM